MPDSHPITEPASAAERAEPTQPAVAARRRPLDFLRPSHRHTALTATLLLMASAFLSRVIGLVRVKYISYLLGRSAAADAFNAAFQLPDMISYLLVGGAASITFVTMLTRYRDEGREREGEEAMSVILTVMLCVLGAAILAAEFLAPVYVRALLSGFEADPRKAALCVLLTRIVLPGQLFFLAGGVFGAVLIARRQFNVQAVAPLTYNAGILCGGLLLSHSIGAASLAVGALAGAFFGPFLLNAVFARRVGMRYRPRFDLRNPGLRQWLRMSIPLMLGVSLVTADNWIINYYASHIGGAVSLLTYAKQLFTTPVALGQAAGIASLPFLATLWGQAESGAAGEDGRRSGRAAFARSVNDSVSRILAFSLLLSAWMMAMARPAVDLIYRGGRFSSADAATMALYFGIFSLSLCFWSAQALYARAFYAAGNTLAPMVASTIVTVLSLPIYARLFHAYGAVGLAFASDAGILIQTLTFAVMLHRRAMVPIGGLDFRELGRSFAAAGLAYAALAAMRRAFYAIDGTQPKRLLEALVLALSIAAWFIVATGILTVLGSPLPGQLRARLRRRRPVLAV